MVKKGQFMWLKEIEIDDLGLVRPGFRVVHPTFGVGEVESIQKAIDGDVTLKVNFERVGPKFLVPEFAKLRPA